MLLRLVEMLEEGRFILFAPAAPCKELHHPGLSRSMAARHGFLHSAERLASPRTGREPSQQVLVVRKRVLVEKCIIWGRALAWIGGKSPSPSLHSSIQLPFLHAAIHVYTMLTEALKVRGRVPDTSF